MEATTNLEDKTKIELYELYYGEEPVGKIRETKQDLITKVRNSMDTLDQDQQVELQNVEADVSNEDQMEEQSTSNEDQAKKGKKKKEKGEYVPREGTRSHKIWLLLKEGKSRKDVAKELGVTYGEVHRIYTKIGGELTGHKKKTPEMLLGETYADKREDIEEVINNDELKKVDKIRQLSELDLEKYDISILLGIQLSFVTTTLDRKPRGKKEKSQDENKEDSDNENLDSQDEDLESVSDSQDEDLDDDDDI